MIWHAAVVVDIIVAAATTSAAADDDDDDDNRDDDTGTNTGTNTDINTAAVSSYLSLYYNYNLGGSVPNDISAMSKVMYAAGGAGRHVCFRSDTLPCCQIVCSLRRV